MRGKKLMTDVEYEFCFFIFYIKLYDFFARVLILLYLTINNLLIYIYIYLYLKDNRNLN